VGLTFNEAKYNYNGGNVSSVSVTMSASFTVGDLAVVYAGWSETGPNTLAITDSIGNTYSSTHAINGQNFTFIQPFYTVVTSPGTPVLTVTGSTPDWMTIICEHYTVAGGTVAYVASSSASNNGNSNSMTSGNVIFTGTVLITSAVASQNAANLTIPSGYTQGAFTGDAVSFLQMTSAYNLSVSSSPANPNYTNSGSIIWAETAGAYQFTASAGTGSGAALLMA
jgi:hypothetical protein